MTVPKQPRESSDRDARRRTEPRARSMHEGITECDDPICCCEPEPRWRELAEQMEREGKRDGD